MEFNVEQTFTMSVDVLQTVLLDRGYWDLLATVPDLGSPTLLRLDEEPPLVRLEARYRYAGPLPSGAGRFIDAERLTWVQKLVHDQSTRTGPWKVVPDHYGGLLERVRDPHALGGRWGWQHAHDGRFSAHPTSTRRRPSRAGDRGGTAAIRPRRGPAHRGMGETPRLTAVRSGATTNHGPFPVAG